MSDRTECVYLSGGCYLITQQLMRHCAGVVATRVGWMGGTGDNPSEQNHGGHAETVEVIFDPARLTLRDLLAYFFMIHRPDLGPEVVGPIYRSEIFFTHAAQRAVAEETIRDVDAAGHWPGTVVTRVTAAGPFVVCAAEEQDYLHRFPAGCPLPFARQSAPAQAVRAARRRG